MLNSFKQLTYIGLPTAKALLLLGVFVSNNAYSKTSDWWFDIEVLLFKRNIDTQQLAEKFPEQEKNIKLNKGKNLLSAYLAPDLSLLRANLPTCGVISNLPPLDTSNVLDPFYLPQTESSEQKPQEHWPIIELSQGLNTNCKYSPRQLWWETPEAPVEPEHFVAQMPVIIDGIEDERLEIAYLLPKSKFTLTKLYNDIRRKSDLTPLMHLAWRQEVRFRSTRAQAYRLYAGKNYGGDYLTDGTEIKKLPTPLVAEESLLPAQDVKPDLWSRIETALAGELPLVSELQKNESNLAHQLENLQDLWELDGLFKVYLQNYGRVPYLHIDSEFNFRNPITPASKQDASGIQINENETALNQEPSYLQSYHFKQLRRVISQQIHYFDHPLFGMVVQIRRYRRPEPPTENEQS